MKTNLLLIIILNFYSCSSQIKAEKEISFENVPQAVKDAFSKSHPNIKPSFQEQLFEGHKTYEADFMVGHDDLSELYSDKGELIERELTLAFNELRPQVATLIKNFLQKEDSHHHIFKVQDVKSNTFNGFELKVKTNKSKTGVMEYSFNPDGSFHHSHEVELETIPTLS